MPTTPPPTGPTLIWPDKPPRPHLADGPTVPLTIGETYGPPDDHGWRNQLLVGDNRQLLPALTTGDLATQITALGGIKLIAIDPPFDVGIDFTMKSRLGTRRLAYRDTWGSAGESFLSFLYRRLWLMRDLLAADGSIYVHCDWRANAHIRLMLDEIFGPANFVNEIVFRKDAGQRVETYFPRKHDTIFVYARTSPREFIFDPTHDSVRVPYADTAIKMHFHHDDGDGRKYRKYPNGNKFYADAGKLADDVWADISGQEANSPLMAEYTGFPNQKPERLLERIIAASSRPGQIVADFFCGSGTTLAVAARMGRRFIGADAGPLAIHTTRCRLLAALDSAPDSASPTGFQIRRLSPPAPAEYSADAAVQVARVLAAYRATPIADGKGRLHGETESGTKVWVAPFDRPATGADIDRATRAAKRTGANALDVLAREFAAEATAKRRRAPGPKSPFVRRLKRIPDEVADDRAPVRAPEIFADAMAVDVGVTFADGGRFVVVELAGFRPATPGPVNPADFGPLPPGKSITTTANGFPVRIVASSTTGKLAVESLTADWHEWIDAWAVDVRPDRPTNGEFVANWHWVRRRGNGDFCRETSAIAWEFGRRAKVIVRVWDAHGNAFTGECTADFPR